MKFKMLVSDMDGTLTYEPNGAVYVADRVGLPPENEEKLLEFISNGGIFCVATGRLLADISQALGPELFQHSYKLVQNGAYIINQANEVISKKCFIDKETLAIYNILNDNDLPFISSVLDCHYYDHKTTKKTMDQVFGTQIKQKFVNSLDERPVEPSNICIVRPEAGLIQDDYQQVCELLKDQPVNCTVTSPYTIDINHESVSKGGRLPELLTILDINKSDVAVAGDSYNDISMFDNFANSYVMSHADQEVKKHAKVEIDLIADIFNKV